MKSMSFKIIVDSCCDLTAQMLKDFQKISTRTTKAAATIITVVPVLCVYPFMQKHFAKGVLVGSIKA